MKIPYCRQCGGDVYITTIFFMYIPKLLPQWAELLLVGG